MRVIGGRFRLDRKIASGGMGDVYRATQVETGAQVAVKILEPSTHPDEDAAERFRTEARVSSLLTHPSIVRVFDLIEEKDGALALVMELLVGQTLEERLGRERTIDPDVAVAIAVPILSALDHAHAAGVIHRDVKPGNVFLAFEPDGRVTPKLLDFGVAKSEASTVRTMDGHILGTSRYVSPEQARGHKLDGRSDLFSVGTLLYESITGESPFAGEDAATALRNVLERVVDAHDRIPPRLWLVVQKALAKQPYARYATGSAMATALANAVGRDEPSLASLLRDERPPIPRLDTPAVVIRDAIAVRAPRRVLPLAIAVATAAALAVALAVARVPAPPKTVASPKSLEAAIVPSILTGTALDATPAPRPSHARAHPRPVATTPGF